MEFKNKKRYEFTLPEIIFISLASITNFILDLVVSPILKLALTHIIAGLFIMVPLNFLILYLTRNVVDKYGTCTLYLTIFGLISIPTPLFGGIAGPYKILVGFCVGVLLDLVFFVKKNIPRIIFIGIIGSIIWWTITFSIWELFDLPFVTAFSNLLNATSPSFNGFIDFSKLLYLPISGFGIDFFVFSVLCGLLSSIPVMTSCIFGHYMFKKIESTAVYQRFQSIQ
ncbi:MAG: hypothetical protein KGD63_03585 [Candidatus Lokiarchaeota archaeon]|nr:hypothetical protein [Candidatus Lokiarchaeota archaeon]